MKRTLRILHVEDQERDVTLITRYLTRAGYEIISHRVETAETMAAALASENWDVILCDYSMPMFNAVVALEVLKEAKQDIPFIIISGTVGEDVAVKAMLAGANDYFLKDNLLRLVPAIERELHDAENRRARREAEEALRASEAELRALFAAITDVIFVIDDEGRFLKVAPTDPTYVSKVAAEMVGKSVHEGFPAELADRFLKHIRQTLAEGRMRRLEYSLELEGAEVWFEGSVSPLSPNSVVWIARDITERKRAEGEIVNLISQLESQRQRLNNIIDNVPGNVWETWFEEDAAAQRVNFTSDYIERMTGYSAEEWLAEPNFWRKIIHPDDKERVERLLAEGQTRTGDSTMEFRWVAKDGRVVWVESRTMLITDHEGKAIGVRGVTMDITERKRAEEQLRRSEERYRDLVENAHDIIYTHDLEGNYTSVNRAVEEVTGYTREEALRLNITQTVPAEQQQKAREMIARKLAGEEVTAYELEILAKDGRRIPVEVNTRIMYQDGAPAGVQGIARDVTERKQLEAQLRQSQKMEAVGQLAGGIAHDFNNLLTAINGYSDLALRKLKEEDPLRYHLEEIKRAGERAAALTRQLLAFSRRQVLQPKVLDLNEVISDMEKMLGRLIGENIDLRTVLQPGLGKVKADPGQVEQVLMNLVVNARDAMPGGGRVTVETENVILDEEYARQHISVGPGPYVMLAVSDTGTGIDEATRARIFEPFFTTKEAGKGTGLGLSTVYGIVKQSGGNIWIYSEVGRGSTFKVYLPRVDEGVQDSGRGTTLDDELHGTETILLAEDDELVRKLAREVLEMFGYQILEAANGGTALLLCERHQGRIDLLLTDVVMPELSGRELSARLTQLRPDMRVLFMSGYTDNAIVHQGVLDADTEFIQKPFTPDALARKVRKVLDKDG